MDDPTGASARRPGADDRAPGRLGLFGQLWAAARLRCPRCGRGPLFQRALGTTMHRSCGRCGLVFDRGEGYFIGAVGLNLIVTEFAALAIWLPVVLDRSVPLELATAVAVGASVLLPILGYKPSRSAWLALDQYLDPR